MTNSSATYNRSVVCDLPDYPAGEITFKLLTYFAAAGTEALPTKVYTLTLDGAGQGTQVLPVPDNTGEAAWLWRVELPDENKYLATLAYSASAIQLTAWLVSAVATVTAASIADQFVLKDGDTMTGQLNFSGTDHAGIKHISLTTAERDALTPVEGMEIYNETTSTVQVYQGGVWVSVGTGGAGAVDSVFGRTGVVIAATSDYDAVQVDVTPVGNIAATNVQAAIEELDSEKEATGTAAGLIATHNDDTTDVHGIADTSILLDENDVGIIVQSFSVKTGSIVSATWGGNKGLHFTGAQTAATHDQTAFARTIFDDPDAATVRGTLGLVIGTDVQAYDAGLADIAGLAVTDGNVIVGDGANWVAESGATARASLGAAAEADVLPKDSGIVSTSIAYEIQAADAGKIIECNGTFTVTCPNGLDTGFQVVIVNVGAGVITIAAATTLQGEGTMLETQYTGATVYHRGSNVWLAMGRLTS